jgi:Domain of unknown function (DUF4105)
MSGWVDFIFATLILANAAGITFWMAGAIYYDVCGGGRWAGFVAAGWVVTALVLFAAWQPLWQPFAVLLALGAIFLGWWFRQQPRHDRDWHPSVALLPRAVREGDVIMIENVRNFEYRSLEEYTPRYEARTYHLANLKGVDVIFFVWSNPLLGHPVLVFDFGPDGRLCMSIEMRYQKGQEYSVLRGLYRQQELIFLAADERDVILRRTKFSEDQKAYLYRAVLGAELLRDMFLDYVDAINSLHEKPRWYHAMCTNCTTAFYQLPSIKFRFDWRVIANGRLDRVLYKAGRLDQTLPFGELRRCAYLNEVANTAPEDGFGDYIRHELDKRRPDR